MADESITLLGVLRDALPLIGVIVGAGLHFVFSRSSELKRHERELRIQAYSDYLQSVGEAETASASLDPGRKAEVFGRAIAAKARVCAHGHRSVIVALSKFEGDPSPGLTEQKKQYFLAFIEEVRKDIGALGPGLTQDSVEKILFGKKQSPNNANPADTLPRG